MVSFAPVAPETCALSPQPDSETSTLWPQPDSAADFLLLLFKAIVPNENSNQISTVIISLCIWCCVTYTFIRLIYFVGDMVIRLGDIFIRLLEQARLFLLEVANGLFNVLTLFVTEFFNLLREIGRSISNLCQVLQVGIMAIWAQLSRENVSLILSMSMILYVFPGFCDSVLGTLRKQLVVWGSSNRLK